jgi:hypothetical protein
VLACEINHHAQSVLRRLGKHAVDRIIFWMLLSRYVLL